MSALRVETLRLCWLEAFIAVADEENISAAASKLGWDQSTISRYMRKLQDWLGKDLIAPGEVSDPDDPRLSIRVTDEGVDFCELAKTIVGQLNDFREDGSRQRELGKGFARIVDRLEADLKKKQPLRATEQIRENIEAFSQIAASFAADFPIEAMDTLHRALRSFFSEYEINYYRERRIRRAARRSHVRPEDIVITSPSLGNAAEKSDKHDEQSQATELRRPQTDGS